MKKTSVVLFTIAFSGAVFAAIKPVTFKISDLEKVTYADGTKVKEGEKVALVWVPKASSVSIDAKGTLSGGEIIDVCNLEVDRENGVYRALTYTIDSDKYTSNNGSLSFILLDTRSWSESGVELAKMITDADGKYYFVNVNASGEAAKNFSPSKTKKVVSSASTSTETAVPEGTPQPEITDIKYDGDKVYITVKNTVPYIQYALSTGNGPDKLLEKVDSPRGGADAEEKEITLVAPAKDVSAFFKVVRR